MASDKKEVIWVRHGESETNMHELFQAGNQIETDPLAPIGEEHAQLLGDLFDTVDYHPDIIIGSALKRARQTAQYIGAVTSADIIVPVYDNDGHITDKPVSEVSSEDESLFRELDLPDELAGLPYIDTAAQAIKQQIKQHRFDEHWHYSNEENLADIWSRAADAIAYLTGRAEARTVVVSHGGFIKACKAWTMFAHHGWPLRQQLEAYQAYTGENWLDNAGFVPSFQYRESGRWQWVETHNYHLSSKFGFMTPEPDRAKEGSAERLHEEGD